VIVEVRPVSRAADAAALAAAFPERPGTPVNRHLRRFDLQAAAVLTMLAAWDAPEPVGYCVVCWPGAGEDGRSARAVELGCAEVADVFVARHARRRGAGRSLLAAAEGLTVARGVARLGLEVTVANPCNEGARRLYAACAYEDAGLAEFTSGYTYWTPDGAEHRDEEPHRYLIKSLTGSQGRAYQSRASEWGSSPLRRAFDSDPPATSWAMRPLETS
jgi:GNAT superfamily N-acetyltransferase